MWIITEIGGWEMRDARANNKQRDENKFPHVIPVSGKSERNGTPINKKTCPKWKSGTVF